jgi:hypothetical protein
VRVKPVQTEMERTETKEIESIPRNTNGLANSPVICYLCACDNIQDIMVNPRLELTIRTDNVKDTVEPI